MDDRYKAFRDKTAAALLDSAASTDPVLRQAIAAGTPPDELRTLVGKIRTRAYTVTDQDVDALRGRYSEDQLFEIVVSAAFGAARERLAAARRALEDAVRAREDVDAVRAREDVDAVRAPNEAEA